jgi:hypothetical protein
MNVELMKRIKLTIPLIFILIIIGGCAEDRKKDNNNQLDSAEYSLEKDARIQQYNLEQQKKLAGQRTSCDTLSLKEFVLNNYPQGNYLVNTDKTLSYSIPKTALLYYRKDRSYIFGIIAKSREGERLIELKNIVGYDQSFIDLDSTELGTAYFYLTLFRCLNGKFETVWESLIPSHGGFNNITMKNWNYKNIPFIEVNFHYGRGTGHINYNYFLIDGINNRPHLLMSYEGINFKRTISNVNSDEFPDYYEHIYYDLGDRIFSKDSVAFVWNVKDSVYVNSRNKRQTRPY